MAINRVTLGMIYALIATVLWSGAFVIARLAVGEISPMTLGASRWFMALIILCCFTLPKLKQEWPMIKKFLPQILIAALTGVTMYSPLSYFGAQTTSAINLSLISVTTPIFIVLLSALAGEKQSFNTWVGCTIALLGSIYLVFDGQLQRLMDLQFAVGDLLMLGAAVGFAVYSLALKRVPSGISQSSILTLMAFLGLLMMLPVLMWEWNQPDFVFKINGTVIFSIVFSAVGTSIAAWWLWNLGLTNAGPARCGMIYYSLPLLGGVFAYIFLGEPMGWVHLVSGLLIVGGIYWSTRQTQTAKASVPEAQSS